MKGQEKRTFSRQEIDAVKERNPIEDVVARYVPLRKRGRSLVGLCPFHNETEPSFHVTPAMGRWHCFGACGEGGDVIEFIMRITGDSFVEALRRLGPYHTEGCSYPYHTEGQRSQQLPPPVPIPDTWRGLGMKEPKELTAEDRRMIRAVAAFYHTAFYVNQEAKDYVTSRGISLLVAQKQMMGHARGDRLVPYLKFKSFSAKRAIDLGLLRPRGKKLQEFFQNRVVLVGTDARGDVIHLIGRALDPDSKPKYLTAPGIPKPVYGMARLNPNRVAELVEGPFDYLVLLEWKLQGLAAMGTHLNDQDARRLARVEPGVNITPDADDAGWSAASEWARAIGPENVRFRVLPAGVKDVGDLGPRPDGRAVFHNCPLITLSEAAGMDAFDPTEPVVVVRSRFDWLVLEEWGYNAVCVLGRPIPASMAKALAIAPETIIIPENTGPGQQVCRDWPTAIGEQARMVFLPDGVKTIRGLAQADGGRAAFRDLVVDQKGMVDKRDIE